MRLDRGTYELHFVGLTDGGCTSITTVTVDARGEVINHALGQSRVSIGTFAGAALAVVGVALMVFPFGLDVGVEKAPLRGAKDAPVTIVLFSDFECPFCAKGEATLRELEAANPGKVRVAFRHRPLASHENAKLAAKASLAAERQGRFWEYHDVLVAHPRELRRDDLERYASELGLDRASAASSRRPLRAARYASLEAISWAVAR